MARHSGNLVCIVAECVVAVLGLEGVDVHRTVGGLCGNILVEGIPCHALDVVVVFGDLTY